MILNSNYNPDILTCLANLSSDEVFTPPALANEILDILPNEIWSNDKIKLLDPGCKSGIFLREITKRLIKGLSKKIPNLQKRINHIFKNQIYAIGITELTALMSRRSLYCSKNPQGKYSITSAFKDIHGNIRYNKVKHKWKNGKCIYCGANEINYQRNDSYESHGYEFIHHNNLEKIFNMKFDVIIGNPPYQLSDGGHSRSASPIYNLFVEKAKQLNPKYLVMIIPARWFVGGKGLDGFRNEMLNDKRIRKIVDYQNSTDVFPGVDIAGGVCYFLWDKDYKGKCEVVNITSKKNITTTRYLNEFDIFVRNGNAIPIIRKIIEKRENSEKFLSSSVSPRKPFSLPTNYEPKDKGVPCWFIQKIGLKFANKSDVLDSGNYLDKWKLLLPIAPIAGQTDFSKPVGFYYKGNTRIAKPGEYCTESWIIASTFKSEKETKFFRSYLFTKVVRFLLLQAVVSQHVTRGNFCFVPDLGEYNRSYTDEYLIKRWNINKNEWSYIDSKISAIKN